VPTHPGAADIRAQVQKQPGVRKTEFAHPTGLNVPMNAAQPERRAPLFDHALAPPGLRRVLACCGQQDSPANRDDRVYEPYVSKLGFQVRTEACRLVRSWRPGSGLFGPALPAQGDVHLLPTGSPSIRSTRARGYQKRAGGVARTAGCGGCRKRRAPARRRQRQHPGQHPERHHVPRLLGTSSLRGPAHAGPSTCTHQQAESMPSPAARRERKPVWMITLSPPRVSRRSATYSSASGRW
jgi:hypothetical protein